MAVKVINVEQGTPEWLDYRLKMGIGGSESGSVLGLNEYQDVFQVYQEKVGMIEPKNIRNENTFWGKKAENLISESWSFYDGKYDDYHIPTYVGREEVYMNALYQARKRGEKLDRKKYVVRECRKAKGLIVNDKYPWLFISPDRLILPNQKRLTDGSVNPNYGYLELKQIGYFHSKQYESGIPPEHETQVYQGMIVLDLDYAELAVLSDGNRLKVYPYEWNQEYVDQILETTHQFWYGNVLPSRDIYTRIKIAEGAGEPLRIIEELWAEFNTFEPEPSNEETYAKFVQKTRHVEIGKSMIGDDNLLTMARNYNAVNSMVNILNKAQLKFKNGILDTMTRNSVDEVHFEGKGWIRNRPNKNSTTPVFKVSDKIAPIDYKVAKQLGDLDFESIYEED